MLRYLELFVLHLWDGILFLTLLSALYPLRRRGRFISVIWLAVNAILPALCAFLYETGTGNQSLFFWEIELTCMLIAGFAVPFIFTAERGDSLILSFLFFSILYFLDDLIIYAVAGMINQDLAVRILWAGGNERRLLFLVLRYLETSAVLTLRPKLKKAYIAQIKQRTTLFYAFSLAAVFLTTRIIAIQEFRNQDETWWNVTFWAGIGMTLLVAFVFYQIVVSLRHESQLSKRRNEMLADNFKQLEAEYRSHSKTMHDIKHHMHVLQIMLEEGDQEKAKDYLQELIGVVQRDSVEHWFEGRLINAILNAKIAQAKQQGINVHVNMDALPCTMPETDLCVVFSNLLDNAIEATVKTSEPEIWLEGRQRGSEVYISLKNRRSGEMTLKDGLPTSTKSEDKWRHGYGISNVIETLERFQKTYAFSYDEEYFRF